jgi:alkylhydroperoxidase/carboxymuconolactone decarboxylase family protein YurZ
VPLSSIPYEEKKEDKMADKTQFEQGRKVTKQLFGERVAKAVEDSLGEMSPGFQEYVMGAFGIYDRPTLDMKMRSAITIAVLTALGRSQELVVHVRGGLNVGLTEEQIREIILQVAIYAGIPASVEAFLVANKMFKKIKEKGSSKQ